MMNNWKLHWLKIQKHWEIINLERHSFMKKYKDQGKVDTRSGFGAGLTELGRTNPNVVALCADLVGSLKMQDFINENPDRFFQIGIARPT